LHRLAEIHKAQRILQIAFYRPCEFGKVLLDGEEHDIPQEICAHFRDLKTIEKLNSNIKVTVFCEPFEDRNRYIELVKPFLLKYYSEKCVIFLDPDTGLEPPRNPSKNHVLNSEAKTIWDAMKSGNVYVFYQHKTNKSNKPWIEPKQRQLENSLGLPKNSIKIAHGSNIASDVVFFYARKP
jgi:hypothetical protein